MCNPNPNSSPLDFLPRPLLDRKRPRTRDSETPIPPGKREISGHTEPLASPYEAGSSSGHSSPESVIPSTPATPPRTTLPAASFHTPTPRIHQNPVVFQTPPSSIKPPNFRSPCVSHYISPQKYRRVHLRDRYQLQFQNSLIITEFIDFFIVRMQNEGLLPLQVCKKFVKNLKLYNNKFYKPYDTTIPLSPDEENLLENAIILFVEFISQLSGGLFFFGEREVGSSSAEMYELNIRKNIYLINIITEDIDESIRQMHFENQNAKNLFITEEEKLKVIRPFNKRYHNYEKKLPPQGKYYEYDYPTFYFDYYGNRRPLKDRGSQRFMKDILSQRIWFTRSHGETDFYEVKIKQFSMDLKARLIAPVQA